MLPEANGRGGGEDPSRAISSDIGNPVTMQLAVHWQRRDLRSPFSKWEQALTLVACAERAQQGAYNLACSLMSHRMACRSHMQGLCCLARSSKERGMQDPTSSSLEHHSV
ncbi:hypothetical protein CLAIMM_05873 isoform 4 [Cladophialophora immunda]|nr:hypothetical protein CLAIMM_05873 isoform 3 [Cladophialophora immunda]OQV00369.1 hypothetical protein CLAIMM_05873 isoform 4 [Cladophialophora immunda]